MATTTTKIKKTKRQTQQYKNKTRRRVRGGNGKFRALQCHPKIKKQRASNTNTNTCMSSQLLHDIKNKYNSDKAPENKIHAGAEDTTVLYKELQTHITECKDKDESCWLNELDDIKQKHHLEKTLYAPRQPKEWAKNKNEWLSNIDIDKVMTQYEETYPDFHFIGPTTIDFATTVGDACVSPELCHFQLSHYMTHAPNATSHTTHPPHPIKTKIGIVFNLDKHDQSGSHWVSLWLDTEARTVMYFDSAHNPVPPEIRAFLDKIHKQASELNVEITEHVNKIQHQYSSSECGMYSLYFIITMLENSHNSKTRNAKIKMFEYERIPDKKVEKFRNVFFNPSL